MDYIYIYTGGGTAVERKAFNLHNAQAMAFF